MSEDARPTTPETPADPTAALPDDPAILRQMVLERLAALCDTRRQNDELQHRLDLLPRRIYGPRTERFDPDQPLLIPDAFEAVAPETAVPTDSVAPEPEPAPKKSSPPHGRRAWPKNLPRVPRVYELTGAERHCPDCGECRIQIGARRGEPLDYQPATLFVIEHIRCTYACPRCEGQVVTAGKPARPIEKGLPGPGLLAHVITEKYADHIPLHRQERRLARQGVELSRSTLCDRMAGAARTLEPLYALMKTLILLCGTVHTDDTPVKVRDSERKIKATGRIWISFGDYLYPYNVFDFTMS
jgi:transposase